MKKKVSALKKFYLSKYFNLLMLVVSITLFIIGVTTPLSVWFNTYVMVLSGVIILVLTTQQIKDIVGY